MSPSPTVSRRHALGLFGASAALPGLSLMGSCRSQGSHPADTLSSAAEPFTTDWKSLTQYRCPAWFRDAKFGIWSHWGPQCVPGVDGWYARNLFKGEHVVRTPATTLRALPRRWWR